MMKKAVHRTWNKIIKVKYRTDSGGTTPVLPHGDIYHYYFVVMKLSPVMSLLETFLFGK